MKLAWIATVALLAPALAGCVTTIDLARSKVGLERDEIPAMSAVRLGRAVAHDWAEDARLTGVFAFESPEGFGEDENVTYPPDPEVGNGLAPAWALGYHSRSLNESLAFVVYPNGTVGEREVETADEDDDEETEVVDEDAWEIDSPEALEILRGNATWQMAEANGTTQYLHALGPDEGNLTWFMMVFPVNATPVFGAVDAVNGSIRQVGGFDFDWDWDWSWEGWGDDWSGDWGGCYWDCGDTEEYEGRLTATDREATHVFEAPRAGWLEIELDYTTSIPSTRVTLEVVGPGGETVEGDLDEGFNSAEWEGPALDAGPYTILLTLDEPGVLADYDLVVRLD